MTGIALLIFTGFIVYVMVWSMKNDGVRAIKDQTGLIRMRESNEDQQGGRRRHEPASQPSTATRPKIAPSNRRTS